MKSALLKSVLLFSLTVLCTHAPAQIITTIAGIYDSTSYNDCTCLKDNNCAIWYR